MKNKLIKSLIATGVAASLVIAIPIFGSGDDAMNISLAELEDMVVGSNLEIKQAKEQKMIEEYKLDKVEAKEGTGTTSIEVAKSREYYPVEAQMNLDYAIWDLAETKEAQILKAKELVFKHNLILEEMALASQKVARLEDVLKQVETKISLGTATISAKNTAQLDIDKASYEITRLNNEKTKLILELNKTLNLTLSDDLTLEKAEIPYEKYVTEDIEKDVAAVLENNWDLEKLRITSSLKSTELNINQKYNSNGSLDDTILSQKESVTLAGYDVKDKELNLEYTVRSDYNNLLSMYDSFIVKELELENLNLTLDVVSKRYEVGLETLSALNLAKENVAYAELGLKQAKLDYYVAVESYKNLVNE
jgi:outer membrane protein TolC